MPPTSRSSAWMAGRILLGYGITHAVRPGRQATGDGQHVWLQAVGRGITARARAR